MNIFEEEIIQPIDIAEFERVFTPEIREVIAAIRKYGFDLRVVGGAVRDFLLGQKPRDIDFVTDADPAELILIFDLEGIQYDAGGINHGTIKAVYGEDKVDVTSIAYKIDVENNKMRVIKGRSWEEDAAGRDLTINSMSLDTDGNIHDYLDGIEDLKNQIVRLNPSQYQKIRKQPEIIMRWFKALTVFDNPKWPQKDYNFIRKHLPLLANIREDSRVAKILGNIIAKPNGPKVIEFMCDLGINNFINLNCD